MLKQTQNKTNILVNPRLRHQSGVSYTTPVTPPEVGKPVNNAIAEAFVRAGVVQCGMVTDKIIIGKQEEV
jgi:hypothetical protein